MTRFWKIWLDLWCVGGGLFGVLLASGAFVATQGPVVLLLQMLGGRSIDIHSPLRFSLAVMGAVSIGWSLSLYGMVQIASRGGDNAPRLWRWAFTSILTWFAIDSLLSLATGFGLNLIPNTLLLGLFLVPIVRLNLLQDTQRDSLA